MEQRVGEQVQSCKVAAMLAHWQQLSQPSGQSLNNSFFHDRVVLEGCWHEKGMAGGTKVTLLALLMSVISVLPQ